MMPNRNKTLVGLPRLYAEPFPLVRRKGEDRDTWSSVPTPTEPPRARRLQVTTRIIRRKKPVQSDAKAMVGVIVVWGLAIGVAAIRFL